MIKKTCAILIVSSMLLQLCMVNIALASEGPMQPEAMQFEPFDSNNMVNLSNGDFSYNIPLLEVPGPEGDWPINIFYHAGVGPGTEGTWAGVGWSINPGAINRFISGYPDDYWNGSVESTFEIDYTVLRNGTWHQIGIGPVGLNIINDSADGTRWSVYIDIIAMIRILSGDFTAAVGFGPSLKVQYGYRTPLSATVGFYYGFDLGDVFGASAGVNVTFTQGKKPNYGGNIGVSYSSDGNTGISVGVGFIDGAPPGYSLGYKTRKFGIGFSSSGFSAGYAGFSANFSGMRWTSGISSQANMEGSGHLVERVSQIYYNLFPLYKKTEYEYGWYLKEDHYDRSFGTLHQLGFLSKDGSSGVYDVFALWQDPTNNIYDDAYNYIEEGTFKNAFLEPQDEGTALHKPAGTHTPIVDYFINTKVERKLINERLFSSKDAYSVLAQGIAGSFSPYLEYSYNLFDASDALTGQFDKKSATELNKGGYIKFRFNGDPGGNFIAAENGWGDTGLDMLRTHSYESKDINYWGSKVIKPAIDPLSGRLLGFRITAEDGKIYEFFRPVISQYQKSYTEQVGGDNPPSNTSTFSSPYATSWLLTGIKGPDYVDRSNDGQSSTSNGFSKDDFGFWIHLTYEEIDEFASWRAPYEGWLYTWNEGNRFRSYNEGLKKKLYLKSIETASHIARFHTNNRNDNIPSKIDKVDISASKWASVNSTQTKFYFPISKSDLSSLNAQSLKIIAPSKHYYYTKTSYYTCNQTIANITQEAVILIDNVQDEGNGFCSVTANIKHEVVAEECDNGIPGIIMQAGKHIIASKLKIKSTSGYLATQNFAKKLNKITVHKKIVYADGKTDYTASFASTNPTIESVNFTYDYNLIRDADNTNENGKLTLRSIQKKGRGGAAMLPPIKFYYNQESTLWALNKFDHWGGYTRKGYSDATDDSNINSQLKSEADQDAAAWKLSTIVTALGSQMNIEYESDIINYIKNDNQLMTYKYAPKIELDFSLSNGRNAKIVNSGDVQVLQELISAGLNQCYIQCFEYDYPNDPVVFFEGKVMDYITSDSILFFTDYYSFYPRSAYPNNRFFLSPGQMFGGGYRVKSISLSDGVETKKTEYDYAAGVVTVLPQDYTDLLDVFIPSFGSHGNYTYTYDSYNTLIDDEFNPLGPGPALTYAEVETKNVDAAGTVIDGKTVYQFFTSADCPFDVQETVITGTEDLITITDKAGLIGNLKSTTVYAIKKDKSDYYPLTYDELIYRFSKDLRGGGTEISRKIFEEDFSTEAPGAGHLGLAQQKYKSQNKTENIKKIDHQVESIYLAGGTSKVYFYDENEVETGWRSTTVDNIGYDSYTGSILVKQSTNSKGEKIINERTPAYWKYGGTGEMIDKNMLSQTAENKTYLLESTDDFYSLTNKNDDLVAANVTTWKNWDVNQDGTVDNIWLPNETYIPIKTKTNFVEFDAAWWDLDDVTSSGDFLGIWKRISNITQYNRYSQAIEGRGLDGTYTSSLYGYDLALPVALAKNAKLDEISYSGFESNPEGYYDNSTNDLFEDDRWWEWASSGVPYSAEYSAEACKTGNQSLRFELSGSGSNYLVFGWWSGVEEGQKYILSAWIKSTTDRAKTNILYELNGDNGHYNGALKRHSGDNTWEYLEVEFEAPENCDGLKLHIGLDGAGTACFDDVRFYPADAQMSTFAYDPLTWQVTSITDANNVTVYYDYDNTGRLRAVKDHNKNVIQKNNYNFGRDTQ